MASQTVTIINVVALLVSPVIAVVITLWFQWWNEKRRSKLWAFHTLLGYRHAPLSEEPLRALNSIDALFYKDASVRRLWHDYFSMLNNEGLNNENGWRQRNTKYLEMLAEMAKVLGYGQKLTHLDIDRVYRPTGVAMAAERSEALADELLRVLRGTQGLAVVPASSHSGAKEEPRVVVQRPSTPLTTDRS